MTRTPPTAVSLDQALRHGYALLQAGRHADAVSFAGSMASTHPGNPHVLVLASEAHLANGNANAALEWISQAAEAAHGDLSLSIKRIRLMVQMRRRSDALAAVDALLPSAWENGTALWQLGGIRALCNRHAMALELYERARRLLGEQPRLLYDIAVAQFFVGEFGPAEINLDRMLELTPQAGHAAYLRATLRRQSDGANHVEDLRRRLAAGFGDAAAEAACFYALSKELEDLGQDEASFAALGSGARRKRGTLDYDVGSEVAAQQSIRDAYTLEVMRQPTASDAGEGAIFIVGMPRTGTTLVERALVQQGGARSAGELLDFGSLLASATQRVLGQPGAPTAPAQASLLIDFAALGSDYLAGARQAADGNARFIDKMPINCLYCGMIHKALPKAKIVHVVRDPVDTCYAVYKTLFFSAYHFSYDLDELAEYYIAYRTTMRHWHSVMPGNILDVRYEDLVDDIEGQTKRLHAWCGIEPEDVPTGTGAENVSFVTASAAQVREPVHRRSVGSSRKHAAGLARLIDRLRDAGVLDPDVSAITTG